jgi:hypothetical protein
MLFENTEGDTLMPSHSKQATKEKNEHPWTTWKQAEQIAADHAKKKKR